MRLKDIFLAVVGADFFNENTLKKIQISMQGFVINDYFDDHLCNFLKHDQG